MYKNTIGFKNNNWGNIRFVPSIKWQGQTGSNGGFAVFDTPENGVRTIMKQLAKYISTGKDTIEKIINTYAPPVENNTKSYIDFVVLKTGIPKNAKISATKENLVRISKAIIQKEIGHANPDPSIFEKAYESMNRASYKSLSGNALGIIIILFAGFLVYKNIS